MFWRCTKDSYSDVVMASSQDAAIKRFAMLVKKEFKVTILETECQAVSIQAPVYAACVGGDIGKALLQAYQEGQKSIMNAIASEKKYP